MVCGSLYEVERVEYCLTLTLSHFFIPCCKGHCLCRHQLSSTICFWNAHKVMFSDFIHLTSFLSLVSKLVVFLQHFISFSFDCPKWKQRGSEEWGVDDKFLLLLCNVFFVMLHSSSLFWHLEFAKCPRIRRFPDRFIRLGVCEHMASMGERSLPSDLADARGYWQDCFSDTLLTPQCTKREVQVSLSWRRFSMRGPTHWCASFFYNRARSLQERSGRGGRGFVPTRWTGRPRRCVAFGGRENIEIFRSLT